MVFAKRCSDNVSSTVIQNINVLIEIATNRIKWNT